METSRGPGRPPLGELKRTKMRNLRLTPAEDAEIVEAAGEVPVAEWLRRTALEKARQK